MAERKGPEAERKATGAAKSEAAPSRRAKPGTRAPRPKSGSGDDPAARIVDGAIALAEEIGWDALRLRKVAARLGLPLCEVLAHYRDLDAVANAWFRRASVAMLAPPAKGFAALPACERLYQTTLRWFDALAPHRRIAGQILRTKLYPSHPHHWVPLAFELSRTIHWLREAALLDAVGRRRQIEEVGLSAIFLATLAVWLRDETPEQARSRRFLRRRLDAADRAMARLCRPRISPDASEAA